MARTRALSDGIEDAPDGRVANGPLAGGAVDGAGNGDPDEALNGAAKKRHGSGEWNGGEGQTLPPASGSGVRAVVATS